MTTAAVRDRAGVPASGRRRAARRRDTLTGYAFVAPNMLLMGLFLFVPIAFAIQLSLQDTQGFGDPEWIGLGNYARMAADPIFWQSLGNTLVFTAITVPIELAGGLALAVLLNSGLPASGVFRTLIVLPLVISGVASGMIAVTIFSQGSGIINKALVSLGLSPVAWQSDGTAAFVSVMITAIWLRIGFNMVIYLAGLQSISPELYEAARIDNANRWQLFRYITVPLVGPSTFFLLIMNVIASFQVFDVVFVMTGGGPGYATSVLGTYAYRNGFQIREQGYGAAIGVVILVITLIFTYVQWRASRTRDLVE
ncbi:carbohydrate ABC transporter membrane protein 1 (CUT1 family) [Labedella gwakjiensis]|uniref:Carbohydrate ABC transporter membrane protein 1 (CUT1 family) n=1 Tax=Labedella gwakjiensis TaxID=390269 RepID=A0A2P8GVZ2_9MICO|nr:sugar ABC transporter permease [Labedella gwakjiensis]PSL38115.1 carbohydrate ABC transporter membrane protein 1 (CUT1 family) [Labedella gwakjiensis]RUQ87334.1 sugar ABC transporter permease [Labedella gwakjiensis]